VEISKRTKLQLHKLSALQSTEAQSFVTVYAQRSYFYGMVHGYACHNIVTFSYTDILEDGYSFFSTTAHLTTAGLLRSLCTTDIIDS
jgi:hypothetical protein